MKYRLTKPRAWCLFTRSRKFGPGFRTRALACYTSISVIISAATKSTNLQVRELFSHGLVALLELRDAALLVVLGGLQVLDLAVLLVATAGMKEGVVASGKSLAEALVVDTVLQAVY